MLGKKIIILVIWLLPLSALASQMYENVLAAERCQDVSCVQDNIDLVDAQIVQLIGKRLAYVNRAAQMGFNQITQPTLSAQNELLSKIALQAETVGYPSLIARSVFLSIMFQSNLYVAKGNAVRLN